MNGLYRHLEEAFGEVARPERRDLLKKSMGHRTTTPTLGHNPNNAVWDADKVAAQNDAVAGRKARTARKARAQAKANVPTAAPQAGPDDATHRRVARELSNKDLTRAKQKASEPGYFKKQEINRQVDSAIKKGVSPDHQVQKIDSGKAATVAKANKLKAVRAERTGVADTSAPIRTGRQLKAAERVDTAKKFIGAKADTAKKFVGANAGNIGKAAVGVGAAAAGIGLAAKGVSAVRRAMNSRKSNLEQQKAKLEAYDDGGYALQEAVNRTLNLRSARSRNITT